MSDRDVSQRKFFIHSAHRTVGVAVGPNILQDCAPVDLQVDSPREKESCETGPHVCFVSNSSRRESDESLLALQAYLESNTPMLCTRVFERSKRERLAPEPLDRCDCLVMLVRPTELEGELLDRTKAFFRRGGSIVAVCADGQGWTNRPTIGRDVLGVDFEDRHDNRPADITLVEPVTRHPVLAGVGPFVAHGALSRTRRLASDADVLLNGSSSGDSYPVAWTHPNGAGRVFCTTLGHPDDFGEPNFLRLLANAVLWAARPKRG